MTGVTPAHDQKITHSYLVHYPEHAPRENDPHYADFNHYREATRATARCGVAARYGPPGDGEVQAGCDTTHPLELHHSHIEFALQNEIDLAVLEKDYPGISNPDEVGAWVESAANLEWLCVFHHRGHGGKHTAAYADYEAELYVKGLIS